MYCIRWAASTCEGGVRSESELKGGHAHMSVYLNRGVRGLTRMLSKSQEVTVRVNGVVSPASWDLDKMSLDGECTACASW